MRFFLPALLLAATQSVFAWVVPVQNELAAMQGDALQEALLDSGLPLPPTREEAEQGASFRFGLDRVAIKRSLVYRASLVKIARNRISPEINRSTAELARALGAPAIFCQYLDMLAAGELSRRQQYELNQALQYLVQETYGIDMLEMRVLAESIRLPGQAHTAYILQLPLAFMFDRISHEPPVREYMLSDFQTMISVLRQRTEILKSVHDRATADAAAEHLLKLVPLWRTTQQTRAYSSQNEIPLSPAESLAFKLLDAVAEQFLRICRDVHKHDWYGSDRLRVTEGLFL